MPTTIIDARATFQEGNKIWLELTSDDKSVTMTALDTMTLTEVAGLIINQQMPSDVDKTLQQQFTIEWHIDVDGIRIVDSVTQEQLPDESAKEGFESLPGWATWDSDEAADWINTSVVDLDSAKTALTQMARAVTYLRDWRK